MQKSLKRIHINNLEFQVSLKPSATAFLLCGSMTTTIRFATLNSGT
jgi:hypothetical protein